MNLNPSLRMEEYEEVSTESDLLDGERYSDFEEPLNETETVGAPSMSSSTRPPSIQSSKKFQKPNFQGVRKYIAAVLEELQSEYPDYSEKELRALATRRWHDLSEDERIGTLQKP